MNTAKKRNVYRARGVVKKENLRRVRSFNFRKLNNYQLFNVRFPLHNSALDPRYIYSKQVIKIMGNLPKIASYCESTYTQKKDNGSLWIINISVSVFPSIHYIPAILPTCATSQTTVKKFYVMMLLGVEARVERTRKRRREKCVFEWHNMKVSERERERLWSEKDISFRCETIIRGCSFEYINIAFDIGILKSFRIINTSCVDNVWEIIVLFPYTLSILPFPLFLSFSMVPAVLYTFSSSNSILTCFEENFSSNLNLFYGPK